MKDDPFNPPCYLSPIVKGIGDVFADIGNLFGAGGASSQGATPTPPPTLQSAAPPVQSPIGNSSTYKTGSGEPSFLSAASSGAPPAQNVSGSKTLLGQ